MNNTGHITAQRPKQRLKQQTTCTVLANDYVNYVKYKMLNKIMHGLISLSKKTRRSPNLQIYNNTWALQQ